MINITRLKKTAKTSGATNAMMLDSEWFIQQVPRDPSAVTPYRIMPLVVKLMTTVLATMTNGKLHAISV